jgi:glucosamine--fructose-6-phosphate aminotransferase (isomerizing)
MLKEAGGVHGEGLSAPQFRHGPLEMAGPGRSALVLVSPGALVRLDLDLAGEMAAAGMGVAALLAAGAPADVPPGVHAIRWPDCPVEPAALVVAAQCLAHACALRQGRVPGTFARIGKVTTRE